MIRYKYEVRGTSHSVIVTDKNTGRTVRFKDNTLSDLNTFLGQSRSPEK